MWSPMPGKLSICQSVHVFRHRGLVVAPMRLEISLYCLPYLFLVCHGI